MYVLLAEMSLQTIDHKYIIIVSYFCSTIQGRLMTITTDGNQLYNIKVQRVFRSVKYSSLVLVITK